jgi:hypothetical protein
LDQTQPNEQKDKNLFLDEKLCFNPAVFIEKHFGKFTPELLMHEIVSPKQVIEQPVEPLPLPVKLETSNLNIEYFDLSVDPKVVGRMSESRTSSDSILPKLHHNLPVEQKAVSVDQE